MKTISKAELLKDISKIYCDFGLVRKKDVLEVIQKLPTFEIKTNSKENKILK